MMNNRIFWKYAVILLCFSSVKTTPKKRGLKTPIRLNTWPAPKDAGLHFVQAHSIDYLA